MPLSIDISNSKVIRSIGEGSYGCVYESINNNGDKFCTKIYRHINPQCIYGNMFMLAVLNYLLEKNIPYIGLNNIFSIRGDEKNRNLIIDQELGGEDAGIFFYESNTGNDEHIVSLINQISFIIIMLQNMNISHNDAYLKNIISVKSNEKSINYIYKGHSYNCATQGVIWKLIDYDVVTCNSIDVPLLKHERYHGTLMMDSEFVKKIICKHITEYNIPWYKRDFISFLANCGYRTYDNKLRQSICDLILSIISAGTMEDVHTYILSFIKTSEKDRGIVLNIDDAIRKIKSAELKREFSKTVRGIEDWDTIKLANDFYRYFLFTKTDDHFLDLIRNFYADKMGRYPNNLIHSTILSCISKNEEYGLDIITTSDIDGDYMFPFQYP